MSFKNLFQNTNWKCAGIIILIIVLLVVILYCFYKDRSNNHIGRMHHTTESMESTNSDSDSHASTESSESNASSKSSVSAKTAVDGELVLYYATWCGYSRMFLPEWEKFEKYAKDNLRNLKVTGMRCEGGNEAVCTQKGVPGYPTIILYLKNGKEITFEGERNSKQLAAFIKKYL